MWSLLVRHRGVWLPALAIGVAFIVEIVLRSGAVLPMLVTVPAAVAAVWIRRAQPFLTLLLVSLCWIVSDRIEPGFNQDGSLAWLATWLVAHYSIGRWTAGVQAWFAPLASAGAAVLLGWDDIISSGASDLAYFLSVSWLPWGAGAAVRVRQARVEELDRENRRLEAEQAEAARRAVAAERSRIARELHDVVSHAIAVTVLQARGARRKLGQDPGAVREALDAIESTNAAALGDMRRLLAVLRDTDSEPSDNRPQPSLQRMDELLAEARLAGLPVDLVVSGRGLDEVPPGVDLSAYRIVQEALTNVLRHAGPGARTTVHLDPSSTQLLVRVRNSRTGNGEVGNGSGLGLVGIRERVAVIGGDLDVGPDGDDFEVRARLPYALEVT